MTKHEKPAAPVAWLSFDEFIQYGRDHGAGEAFGGMPWSFDFHGTHVSHETDTHYLIGSKPYDFRPGDYISVDAVESEPALISILPVIVRDVPEACKVTLKVGVQTFHVGPDYCESRDEGEHHARMLALALNRWAHYPTQEPQT